MNNNTSISEQEQKLKDKQAKQLELQAEIIQDQADLIASLKKQLEVKAMVTTVPVPVKQTIKKVSKKIVTTKPVVSQVKESVKKVIVKCQYPLLNTLVDDDPEVECEKVSEKNLLRDQSFDSLASTNTTFSVEKKSIVVQKKLKAQQVMKKSEKKSDTLFYSLQKTNKKTTNLFLVNQILNNFDFSKKIKRVQINCESLDECYKMRDYLSEKKFRVFVVEKYNKQIEFKMPSLRRLYQQFDIIVTNNVRRNYECEVVVNCFSGSHTDFRLMMDAVQNSFFNAVIVNILDINEEKHYTDIVTDLKVDSLEIIDIQKDIRYASNMLE